MNARAHTRIAVVAPSRRIERALIEEVQTLVRAMPEQTRPVVWFHPQCFIEHGHFAGPDETRLQAFLETANNPEVDAIWFARGGYGAGRIASEALPRLTAPARQKTYLGYSDAGFFLAGLYKEKIGRVAHGPMPADFTRPNGRAAVERALNYLAGRPDDALEPTVRSAGAPVAAFNISVLASLLGTGLAPDLGGHVLHLEDVGEYHYRLDRAIGQIMRQPWAPMLRGVRLGRCTEIPENDIPFGQTEEEIVKHWCGRAGVPFLGASDIGHDANNRVAPFGKV